MIGRYMFTIEETIIFVWTLNKFDILSLRLFVDQNCQIELLLFVNPSDIIFNFVLIEL